MCKDEEQKSKGEYNGSSEKSDHSQSGAWEREGSNYQNQIGDGSVKEGYQPNTTVDTTKPPEGDDEN